MADVLEAELMEEHHSHLVFLNCQGTWILMENLRRAFVSLEIQMGKLHFRKSFAII